MKRALKVIWRIFIGLLAALSVFLLIWIIVLPLIRGRSIHHQLLSALDHASSVKVVEHSCRWDAPFNPNYKEVTYATVVLTPDRVMSLHKALPLALDCSGLLSTMCIFEEHHYIAITEQDGSTLTLHICFHCGEIELNDDSQRIMPWGWPSSLSKFISSIGLHPDGPWPPTAK